LFGIASQVPLFLLVDIRVVVIGRFHEAFDAAAVESTSLELVREYLAGMSLGHQCVGDLDFPTATGGRVPQDIENVRGQDVATDDGKVAEIGRASCRERVER